MIRYKLSTEEQDLRGILSLQSENLTAVLEVVTLKSDGFVTLKHDLELLKEISRGSGHTIAVNDGKVIGYALTMWPELGSEIDLLRPILKTIKRLKFKNVNLMEVSYMIMGQVCVEKEFRGRGVFKGLYEAMRDSFSSSVKYVITSVATENTRSIRAHEKMGFEELIKYNGDGEEWSLIIWDWMK